MKNASNWWHFVAIAFLFGAIPGLCQETLIPNAYDSTYTQAIQDHREAYKADFLTNPHSPLENHDLVDLQFYSPNHKYKVTATVTLTPDTKPFDLPTYSGITKKYRQYAWVDFSIGEDKIRMAVYQNLRLQKIIGYKEALFLPFKDLTSGEETYGGGRYIDLKMSDIKDGFIEIDFNKSYNPYCAYSSGYNCPIPPAPNHLKIAVLAGERNFTGEHNERKE
ncbi:MAG: DUF1684 domain-containing protein [Bacteroidota bacterium]